MPTAERAPQLSLTSQTSQLLQSATSTAPIQSILQIQLSKVVLYKIQLRLVDLQVDLRVLVLVEVRLILNPAQARRSIEVQLQVLSLAPLMLTSVLNLE